MLTFINSTNNILTISNDASYVVYNDIKYNTNVIYMFSPVNIKLTFNTVFLIKYSKNELNLYHNKKLIDTFKKI